MPEVPAEAIRGKYRDVEIPEDFEHVVYFDPAYDHRDQKGGGVGSVELSMGLVGSKGAVTFTVLTDWVLPGSPTLPRPIPASLAYHSYTSRAEGQIANSACRWLHGQPCYFDLSASAAERVFDILVREGSDGVWRYLEEFYRETF